MRKILLSFAIALTMTTGFAWSQCSPNVIYTTIGLPGLWPNATIPGGDTLPEATQGVAYSPMFWGNVLTMIVPADTTVDLGDFGVPPPFDITLTVDINYMEVVDISGLPPGMTSDCDNDSCRWSGGSNGCAIIQGTPTAAGDYTVTANINMNIQTPVGPISSPIPVPVTYFLRVDNGIGIDDMNLTVFSVDFPAPNPVAESSAIRFNMVRPGDVTFTLTTLAGQTVSSETIKAAPGLSTHTLRVSELANGLYLCHITSGNETLVRKITVAH